MSKIATEFTPLSARTAGSSCRPLFLMLLPSLQLITLSLSPLHLHSGPAPPSCQTTHFAPSTKRSPNLIRRPSSLSYICCMTSLKETRIRSMLLMIIRLITFSKYFVQHLVVDEVNVFKKHWMKLPLIIRK